MKRTTFSFDPDTTSRLNELAAHKGISNTEVIRRAVALYETIERERSKNSPITIQNKDNQSIRLILP